MTPTSNGLLIRIEEGAMHMVMLKARHIVRIVAVICVAAGPVSGRAQVVPTFVPMGFLPGGYSESYATAVSGDGAVVVGYSIAVGQGVEAFRWTEATGMVGLGGLPGGEFYSEAWAVSEDGSVVVGHSHAY